MTTYERMMKDSVFFKKFNKGYEKFLKKEKEMEEKKKEIWRKGMNIICFHNPDEENGYLSNWYKASFIIDNISFSSMEQYMMYKKAMVFNDEESAQKILKTSDVREIKQYGREVRGYNESVWNGLRQLIVYEGLMGKFSQNLELKERLKSTSPSFLAECAVKDRIWGIGLSMKDEDRLKIDKWRGENLLGYTLMKVREKLEN